MSLSSSFILQKCDEGGGGGSGETCTLQTSSHMPRKRPYQIADSRASSASVHLSAEGLSRHVRGYSKMTVETRTQLL
eukprot:757394-Hanusia_phi.AAC.8